MSAAILRFLASLLSWLNTWGCLIAGVVRIEAVNEHSSGTEKEPVAPLISDTTLWAVPKLGLFGKLSLLRLDRNKTASSIALTALWL